ncbi:hypothetical protein CcarbDRAFT_2769 [Clostridium carboxidivorans P7]|uniref:Uncharacterized protein n=1 Tax=Clostridium carboxidivorans P7 TaxID=536227 RepID=C6PVF2_9CLOT|nr:hypothetical protein CcarbDRAFT_2769 [Clostridium carboxidivorans P7]
MICIEIIYIKLCEKGRGDFYVIRYGYKYCIEKF